MDPLLKKLLVPPLSFLYTVKSSAVSKKLLILFYEIALRPFGGLSDRSLLLTVHRPLKRGQRRGGDEQQRRSHGGDLPKGRRWSATGVRFAPTVGPGCGSGSVRYAGRVGARTLGPWREAGCDAAVRRVGARVLSDRARTIV